MLDESSHSVDHRKFAMEVGRRTQFEDDGVFSHLRLDMYKTKGGAHANNIEDLVKKYPIENAGALTSLRELAASSSASAKERLMYPHLLQLFQYALTSLGNNELGRAVVEEQELRPDIDVAGFSLVKPDFTIVDHGKENSNLWRHRAVFVEVKASEGENPKVTPTGVSRILAQAATYARLHMSARPFQLFSVGLLIWGTHFCVAIFDRGSVRLSPAKSIIYDCETFIAVVRNLGHVLSDIELGQDPTVIRLDEEETRRLTGDQSSSVYPSYVIKPFCGKDSRWWCTVGPMIWSSVSLFGCGTLVFRVREYKSMDIQNHRLDASLGEATVVMKTAWRDSGRNSESEIYGAVRGGHPALASHIFGEDVLDADGNSTEVRQVPGGQEGQETKILHRLFISTLGRPIWEYETELELLKGFLAALSAHEWLSTKKKLLHRDISAGNILLAADFRNAPSGAEGFLCDLEYARVNELPKDVTEVRRVAPVLRGRYASGNPHYTDWDTSMKITFGYTTAKRGADLTGTLQFMSLRILKAIDENQAQPSQGIADDIESFIYVLGYAVLMKITRQTKWDTSKRKYWQDTFDAAFGKIDHKDIVKARVSIAPLEWAQKAGTDFELEEIGMSRPFFNILLRLFILLQDVHRTQVRGNIGKNPYVDDTVRSEVSSQPEIMLGYREFREILEQGITKLELRE